MAKLISFMTVAKLFNWVSVSNFCFLISASSWFKIFEIVLVRPYFKNLSAPKSPNCSLIYLTTFGSVTSTLPLSMPLIKTLATYKLSFSSFNFSKVAGP